MTRATFAAGLLGAALLVAACGDAPPSATAPPASASPEEPAETPEAGPTCPDIVLDPSVSLGPPFDKEVFEAGEASDIASTFVAGLSTLYAGGPDANPCLLFTTTGLQEATAVDERLRLALEGISRVDTQLVFREAGEGTYDLRQRPPRVPLDIVFDVPAGSTTTDSASGATDTTLAPERDALRVTFEYDGDDWLADGVEPVSATDMARYALPTPMVDLPACKGFHDDPDRARFDDNAGSGVDRDKQQPWCADGGNGPGLPEELVHLRTRVPCGESRVAVLNLGVPLGTPRDPLDAHRYFRDPLGQAFKRGLLDEKWTKGVKLPDDAQDTGWTNGNMDLWVSPSELEEAVYVRTAGGFERWPRGGDPSVTDCN